ncbi:MAG: DUF6249 domain-containing protein [Aquabacterium sp.]
MDATLIQKGVMPMVIAVTGILAPVLLVALVLWFKQNRTDRLYDLVRDFAQKGLPVPRELLEPPEPRPGSGRLVTAMTLLGAGAGLSVMFWFMNSNELVGIGALPGFIGLGQLLALWIESRRPAPAPTRE